MHTLMLVTLTLPASGTSEEACNSAYSRLSEDGSFCGEGGRFGCPLADWFVIGGRWSGILREAILGQPYNNALEQEFPEFTKGYFPSSLMDQRKASLDQLWQSFGGTGKHPLVAKRLRPLWRRRRRHAGRPVPLRPLPQVLCRHRQQYRGR